MKNSFDFEVCHAKQLGDKAQRMRLLQESNELVAIFVVVVRNLKETCRRRASDF